MKKLNSKTISIFLILLFLDINKPFGYALAVDFLFLGIVYISFSTNLTNALVLSIIFGLLRDSVSLGAKPINFIEFPLICLMSHYLISYFSLSHKKVYLAVAKNIIVIAGLIIHIIIHSISEGIFLPFFSLKFLFQSFLIFFLVNYMLEKKSVAYPI